MSEISGLDDIRTMMVARTDRARGFRQVVIPPVPAAGTGFVFAAPRGYWALVTGIRWTFTASAAVATRVVSLTIANADGVALAAIPGLATITAGQAVPIYQDVACPATLGAVPAGVTTWLPPCVLKQGSTLALTVAAEDVADQITVASLTVQQYPDYDASGSDTADWERVAVTLWEQMRAAGG